MSSAILYVAIVAIWACVLIPRWLRRDSAHGAASAVPETNAGDAIADDGTAETAGSAAGPDGSAGVADGSAAGADGGEVGRGGARAGGAVRERDAVRAEAVRAGAAFEPTADAGERRAEAAPEAPADDAPPPLTPEESRQRMLTARRRLLGMLLVLEAAAIALAVLGLAALWVVIPPSVMLAGYLLLLREAAHADADQAERERQAEAARATAYARARAQERARARAAAAAAAASAPAAAPAGTPSGDEDTGPGRDFAPGLAGKYTTSNADVIDISERAAHDGYERNKLRAVGD